VIVTLDTTRADRLPAYGFAGVATPALDALARDGVVFERASTVAPLTLPAHTSLFTGLYPSRHGVRDNASDALPAGGARTLAEMLQARGFRTSASVGSVVVAADRGLARGFDTYRDVAPDPRSGGVRRQRPANEVVDAALSSLDGRRAGTPFFLWVHLYDAHQPYAPPEPFASAYAADPYLGEIAFADAQLARLLGSLASRGLMDRTAVIVAGDHGESLGEHGEQTHGLSLYESVLHVPGVPAGRAAGRVSLVDVMPTVLDLMGIEAAGTDGMSLMPVMTGRPGPRDRDIFAESLFPLRFGRGPLRAVMNDRFKFIDAADPRLYDLASDPGEKRSLYIDRPALAAAMARALDARGEGQATSLTAIDAPLRDRLASLGYAGTSAGPRK
jgi:arylsulfatase A-like enzyme